MASPFSTVVFRFVLAAAVSTTGLLTTACMDDNEIVSKDYTGIDEEIIKKYIADNKITTAQRQPSGLYFVPVTSNSSAVKATAGKTVAVLYTGRFLDGRVFDASSQHGNVPIEFVLGRGQVIQGWDEGIALMNKGDKAEFLIPSALAYGSRGAGSSIPPNTVLRFEVELTDVK